MIAVNGREVRSGEGFNLNGERLHLQILFVTVLRSGREVEVQSTMREVQNYGEVGWVPHIPAVIGVVALVLRPRKQVWKLETSCA